ncbi:MAG: hypothetical protein Q8O27_00780 [Enterobacteriaceae bacterium]|nr:hypothetical protein [Enterobacteriaceae bacterium]
MDNELKKIRLSPKGKSVFPKLIGREIYQVIPLKASGRNKYDRMIRILVLPNKRAYYYHESFFILNK